MHPSLFARSAPPTRCLEPTRTCIQLLINNWISDGIIMEADWAELPVSAREELVRCPDRHSLLPALVQHGLLTTYQAARIEAGKTFGLILANYRILDRLGAGAMGVVFRAEHRLLRRPVAIKVLSESLSLFPVALRRFESEMRAIAHLQHPNIVTALDAGETPSADPDAPVLRFLVMEYVPGEDLETYVEQQGPLDPVQVCDLAFQVASALAEAHKHGLIHRDLKPSNVQRTPEGKCKLLDFGLAQHFAHRHTEPGTVLGTFDYMAPEQAKDSSSVDARADLYALGATMFWCLTGRSPFGEDEETIAGLVQRQTAPPPLVSDCQPSVPAELSVLVARMMAPRPADRYPSAESVMTALLPFLQSQIDDRIFLASPVKPRSETVPGIGSRKVLIVDDEPSTRQLCRCLLGADNLECDDCGDGLSALSALAHKTYDVVLLDMCLPGLSGMEMCRRLRAQPASLHLKVILFSGDATGDEMAQVMLAGADDYLSKPFSPAQLRARVQAALRLKDAQDRSEMFTCHLRRTNQQLEQHLNARDGDLLHVRNALALALGKMVERREGESGAHLQRMQHYCRALAEEAASDPRFTAQVNAAFLRTLECCVPVHDIGKVMLPDHILFKPGKLDPDERLLMQTHTISGSELLRGVAREHASALSFLQMAIDITRHHHERYDGEGYPDQLAGDAIPLAARLVALADVYDALRSHRPYKPALTHLTARQLILSTSGQFDPDLLQAFQRCHGTFERIFAEHADSR
jgi:response regulator RpfG family c-di-GMP phosphodiesterase